MDGLCCSSSATQTRLGLSSLLEERIEIPIVSVVSFVLSATPQTGGNGQGIEIDRQILTDVFLSCHFKPILNIKD